MPDGVFDPATVPVYPVVRMSLVRGQACVDDELVTVPRGMEPREAALAVVARRAAAREGSIQAVRAVASDEAGHSWAMVVDAHGKAWSLDDAAQVKNAPNGGHRGSGQARVGARVAVLGAAVVLIGGLVGGLAVARSDSGASPSVATRTVVPTATATELPVVAPVGWSAQALWSSPQVPSPDTSAQAGPGVVVTGQSVFAVTTSSGGALSLSSLSARSGAPVWSKKLQGSQVTQGPVLAKVQGAPVVLVATDTKVSAWSLAGLPVGSWSVPVSTGTTGVVLTPAGPIIPRSQTTVSIVGPGMKLLARALPAGGRPVALLGQGTLVVTDTSGHAWRVTSPAVAGTPATLAVPKGWSGGTTVAVTSSSLIQAWRPAKTTTTDTVILRSSPLTSLTPRWTSKAITTGSRGSELLTSPSGGLGVLGGSVVDLATGGLRSLPAGWTAQLVSDRVIWATNTDQKIVAASPAGAALGGARTGTTPSTTGNDDGTGGIGAVVPVGLVGSSALVIGSADNIPRLYLLPTAAPRPAATPQTSGGTR